MFGIETKLTGETAQPIYDELEAKLARPEYSPRALFERFNIEVLTTTDAATDSLETHRQIQESDWEGKVLPTFRPDAVVNLTAAGWRENVELLGEASGIAVDSFGRYVHALEVRRSFFKEMGATATDHAAQSAYTAELEPGRS